MAHTFEQLLASTSEDLHLFTAVELINATAVDSINHSSCDDELASHALQYLRLKAAKGDVEAKIKLSTIMDRSENDKTMTIQPDKREALVWARSIFDRRLSGALAPCVTALMRPAGNLDNKDQKPGKLMLDRVLERAEEGDEKEMCHLVGVLLVDGIGLERNVDRGVDFLKRAAEHGHEEAGIELATILGDSFKYPAMYDLKQSLEIYERVAQKIQTTHSRKMSQADARALTDLARMYYEGEGSKGVERDVDKAYYYARQVAENTGEQYCQYIVGDALLHALGSTGRDVRQALFWLTQSGEQGFPLAVEALSKLYFEGSSESGMKQDYEQAHYWCIRGDDIWPSGLGYCQTCLGDMHRAGLGVPKDLVRSFEYYQKAASQQDAPQNYARYMLGEM
ncbi:hypothetical protein J3Q64DRAFT_1451715 [Phycomyces blakesleeanus]|uniref:HCP-like protein n=1 Tax=Phycomyces blakesleeanus TaxID=4837 RepID=A0ABR3B2V6_PHYBL